MARNIKWQLRFKSLRGYDCHVDIYEEGYTGSTVTQLTGAAEPFVIEEDEDTNLLSLIRTKTAYLRLIETTYGELNAILPQTATAHFVKAYYGGSVTKDTQTGVWSGGTLVFCGYMQPSEYINGWVATPRDLEFAITSPLGLLDSFTFTPQTTPSLTLLGSILKQVLEGLNADYSSINYYGDSLYPWNTSIFYTAICPYNSAFKHYMTADKMYEPKTYRYFIEGICAAMGWIVHEAADIVIFQKVDAAANTMYSSIAVDNLSSLTGRSDITQFAESYSSYFGNCDTNAKQSFVKPINKLTLSMEGSLKALSLSAEHTVCSDGIRSASSCRYVILSPQGTEVDGQGIGSAVINGDGLISSSLYGLFPLAYGRYGSDDKAVSLDEFWVTRYSSSWADHTPLITWRCYSVFDRSSVGWLLIKAKIQFGSSLADLSATGTHWFAIVIKVGNKYYNLANDTWSTSIVYNDVAFDNGSVRPNKSLADFVSAVGIGDSDINDVNGLMVHLEQNAAIYTAEISIYNRTSGEMADGRHIKWEQLEITSPSTVQQNYINTYGKKSEVVINNTSGNGLGDDSLTINIQDYAQALSPNSFGIPGTSQTKDVPSYGYMFKQQTWLYLPAKRTVITYSGNMYQHIYIDRYTYWISGLRWRVIGFNINLSEDIFTANMVSFAGL